MLSTSIQQALREGKGQLARIQHRGEQKSTKKDSHLQSHMFILGISLMGSLKHSRGTLQEARDEGMENNSSPLSKELR